MPDHVHLLVSMSPDHDLATTVGLWKRWLAKKHAIAWQFNFFDHRLRGDESADQKARYILANPVRAGLAEREEDWPYAWIASGE
jgi:putative transposase